jgi:DNA-directed RNA polymerase specialized sigma54-like protein
MVNKINVNLSIMAEIVLTTKTELAATIHQVLDQREAARKEKENLHSLTINQVAKRLGRANATISKYVAQGLLKTTRDGRIPEVELERFLNDQ